MADTVPRILILCSLLVGCASFDAPFKPEFDRARTRRSTTPTSIPLTRWRLCVARRHTDTGTWGALAYLSRLTASALSRSTVAKMDG